MDQKPMKKVSGISGAGPVLVEVMKLLMHSKYPQVEKKPETISRHEICALSGKKPGLFCQHKKIEFFRNNSRPSEECEFHREVIVRNCVEDGDEIKLPIIIYPDKYQSFINERPFWSIQGQIEKECPEEHPEIVNILGKEIDKVRIKKPLPGSIYAIDPNIPIRFQKLKIELDHVIDVKKVIWKFGNEIIIKHSAELNWSLKRGKHTISATVEFKNGKIIETKPIDISVL